MLSGLSKRPIDIKQANILNASLTLFLHWDFQEVSVKQIISAADVSKGAFYRFYGRKNELLLDLLMDEAFHVDQSILKIQDMDSTTQMVKLYFLEVGRHLERYQLHQKIERYLEKSDIDLFRVFQKWKKNHQKWVKNHLLIKENKADLLYAQLWAMLEGSVYLHNHPHFQNLCGRRHPFELLLNQLESESVE